MASIKQTFRISLATIEETGFSIKDTTTDGQAENIGWRIGFRPAAKETGNHESITIEVRAEAVDVTTNEVIGLSSIAVTYCVSDFDSFISFDGTDKININDKLLLNLLNPAFGTLRGVMYTRFKGTFLESMPLPLIDVSSLVKPQKSTKATKEHRANKSAKS
jgi:hypothetical protein